MVEWRDVRMQLDGVDVPIKEVQWDTEPGSVYRTALDSGVPDGRLPRAVHDRVWRTFSVDIEFYPREFRLFQRMFLAMVKGRKSAVFARAGKRMGKTWLKRVARAWDEEDKRTKRLLGRHDRWWPNG